MTDLLIVIDPAGPRYPPYLHTLVENFCLGARRLHLFGKPDLARRGWVTLGNAPLSHDLAHQDTTAGTSGTVESVESFDAATYAQQTALSGDGRHLLPFHPEIDNLRPKSPVRKSRGLPGGPSPMQGHPGVMPHPYDHHQGGRQAPRAGGGFRPQQQQGYHHPQAGMHQQGRPFNTQNQHQRIPGSVPSSQYGQYPGGFALPGMYGQMGYPDMQMGGFPPGFDNPMQAQLQMQMQMHMQMQMQMQMQAQMHAQQLHMQMMMGMGGPGMGMGMGMSPMGGMMGGGGHGGNFGHGDSPSINLAGPISPGTSTDQPRFETLPDDQDLEGE